MTAASLRCHSQRPGQKAATQQITAGGLLGWGVARCLGGLAAILTVLAAGCGPKAPSRGTRMVEVSATTPIIGEVRDFQDFTGRLDAADGVELRARVTGYVDKVPFKEGDLVKKDAVVFSIDSRTYKADLAQAEANLKLAHADRTLQELTSTRARMLIRTRSIGQEEFDQAMAAREKARLTILSMEAARDRAALYVGFAEVKSPISGRISRRNVDPGNLVKADDTILTTIMADDKVKAYFDVDERTYLNLVGANFSVSSASGPALHLPVLMRLANEEEFTHSGNVDFIDNRLNGNTGTIRMRGIFDNPRGILKAGLFVRIRLPIGEPYKTLLVPDEALQSDQGRKFVYVIDGDSKVVYRPVNLGQAMLGLRVIKNARYQVTAESLTALATEGVADAVLSRLEKLKDNDLESEESFVKTLGKTLSQNDLKKFQAAIVKHSIKEGVKEGDRVIISGMQRIRPKDQVQVKMQTPPKAPEFPLVKPLAPLEAKKDDVPLKGEKGQLPAPPHGNRIGKRS